jgi:dihydroxyacetone kinase-like predicted kinase
MQIQYIDGLRLRNAVIAGTESVFRMREHLNRINLFPIPDKDTGTNLSATFRYVVELLQRHMPTSIEQTSKILAEGALLAAQGNSGAILAQFFSGTGRTIGRANSRDHARVQSGG